MTNKDFALMLLWIGILAGITYFAHSNDALRAWADKQTQVTTEQIKTFERAYNDVPVDNEKAKEWLLENVPESIELDPTPRKYETKITLTENDIQRIESCGYAFEKFSPDWERTDFIVRCATFSELIKIVESGTGTSRRCVEDSNCHGMKQLTYKEPLEGIPYSIGTGRFLVFEDQKYSTYLFSNLYAKWHYKKPIPTMISGWSHTDQGTYIKFVQDRWDNYSNKYREYVTK